MKFFLSDQQKQFVLDEYCVYVLTGEMNTIFSLTEALYLIEVAIDQMGLTVPRFNISDEITFPENNSLFGKYRTITIAVSNLTGMHGSSILPDVIKNHFFQLYQGKIPSITADMANAPFDSSALARAFINSGVYGKSQIAILDDHINNVMLTGQGVIGGRNSGKSVFQQVDSAAVEAEYLRRMNDEFITGKPNEEA